MEYFLQHKILPPITFIRLACSIISHLNSLHFVNCIILWTQSFPLGQILVLNRTFQTKKKHEYPNLEV